MVGIIQIEEFHSGIPRRFLIFRYSVLEHFSADPAITPINATGHQLVNLCRSVCAEAWAQILEPIVSS